MKEQLLITIIVCFISFVDFIGGTIYISALPELSIIFQASSSLIKFSITAYFFGLVVGTILSGFLSEAYGRKHVLISFILLGALSGLFCAFSQSISQFLVGRFLQGMGQAGGPILVMSFVADHFKGDAYKRMVSLLLVMVSFGPGIAPVIGSIILHFFDWRAIFYFLSFLDFLSFIFLFFINIEPVIVRRKVKETLKEYMFFFRHPLFRYYSLMIGSLYGCLYAFLVLCPFVFRIHYGWKVIDFTWIGLAIAFSDSLGSYFEKVLTERMSSQNVLFTSLVLTIVFFLALLLIGVPVEGQWVVAIVTLFMFGNHIFSTCLTSDALKLGAEYSNMASSLISFSKVGVSLIVLVLIPFIPSTLTMIKLTFFIALLICTLGYMKIRKSS
ncbi:MAG: MFS transporter [Proteobacteria bacterium]|nr:MFS transporter [Pseudomonadota bacterium]